MPNMTVCHCRKGAKWACRFETRRKNICTSARALEGGKDLKRKKAQLERHLIPFFGEIPLSKINSSEIECYKQLRQQALSLRGGDRVSAQAKAQGFLPGKKPGHVKPGTINRELAALSHLFNKALEWGWIDYPPAKLIESAEASNNPQLYLFIVIGLETSMRLSEILSMRRENIDLERRVIWIPKAKAGKREQPITAHWVAALPPGTPWLFPSPAAQSGHTVDIRKPFIKAVVAAGLDPALVVRHTLRHTAITHLVQAGID